VNRDAFYQIKLISGQFKHPTNLEQELNRALADGYTLLEIIQVINGDQGYPLFVYAKLYNKNTLAV
jgi:hypothetical protein